MQNENLLSMQKIMKYFYSKPALDEVDFELQKGEVHALLGQNGAGKSTLIKILTGVHKLDGGKIIFEGKEVLFKSTKEAQDNGIRTIYQEVNLVDNLSVSENIFLGQEIKGKSRFLNKKMMNERSREILQELRVEIKDVTLPLKNYSIAVQQMIAIARAINWDAKIIIMDEPTASLDEKEVEILFKCISHLKQKGISIIFISHKIDEIFFICDRVTVLRDGKKIDVFNISEINPLVLIQSMIGRKYYEREKRKRNLNSELLLYCKKLEYLDKDVSFLFEVNKNEVIGFAGLVGSGRTEFMKALIGADNNNYPNIVLDGIDVKFSTPKQSIQSGLVYSSENRKEEGIVLNMSIEDNIILSNLKEFSRFGIVNRSKQKKVIEEMVKKFSIKLDSPKQKVKDLSGGNQQKVVLAKSLVANPKILILDEPTKGIDIQAKNEIFEFIDELTKQGISIILISSELQEVVDNSDRIYVMNNSKIIAHINSEENITEEKIHHIIASS